MLSVTIWLVFLPLLTLNAIIQLLPDISERTPEQENTIFAAVVALLLLGILMVWGHACVLVAGRRLLQKGAGRTRTSFKATRKQAAGYVLPLLITSILRAGTVVLYGGGALAALGGALLLMLLWTPGALPAQNALMALLATLSLPLALPAVLYALRTAFMPVAVVCEDTAYRPGLAQSIAAARDRTWTVALRLIGLWLTLLLPVQVLDIALEFLPLPEGPSSTLLHIAIVSAAQAPAAVLYTLSIIQLYAELRKEPPVS